MSRLYPESICMVRIEHDATPRVGHCPLCVGGLVQGAAACFACRGTGKRKRPPPFEKDKVTPIGRPSRSAEWTVTVDGQYYASYSTEPEARSAAKNWLGYTDGLDRPIDDRKRAHWPAVEHRVVRVERADVVRRREGIGLRGRG